MLSKIIKHLFLCLKTLQIRGVNLINFQIPTQVWIIQICQVYLKVKLFEFISDVTSLNFLKLAEASSLSYLRIPN